MGLLFLLFAFLLAAGFHYGFDDSIGKKVHPIMQQSTSLMMIGFLSIFATYYFGITIAITYNRCDASMEVPDMLRTFLDALVYGDTGSVFLTEYSALEVFTLLGLIATFVYGVTMKGYIWFSNILDKEIWNTKVLYAEYYQSWTEEYWTTEVYYETNSDGEQEMKTKQVRKEEFHAACWIITTELGDTKYITEEQYNTYVVRFNSNKFESIYRSGRISGSDTGNKYISTWNGNFESMVPASVEREYVNYIQGSPWTLLKYSGNYSQYATFVPNYPLVINSDFGTLDIDRVQETDVLLPNGWESAVDTTLSQWLANHANRKQVNLIVVLTHHSEEFFYALHQKWDGGNKNDVILVLGVDQNIQMSWGKVMSWSSEELFRERALQRLREVKDIGGNPHAVAQILIDEVDKGFVRRTMESLVRLASRMRLPWYGILTIIFLITLLTFFPIAYYAQADMGDEIVMALKGISKFFQELVENVKN